MSHHNSGVRSRKEYNVVLAKELDKTAWDLFDLWHHREISDQQYADSMDILMESAKGCPVIHDNLRSRLDGKHSRTPRSLGEFALMIGRQALPEHRDAQRWFDSLLASSKRLLDNGMEANGAIVFSPRKVHGAPDFRIEVTGCDLFPDGVHLVEIKHNPSLTKLSFKLWDLQRYASAGAYILVVFGNYKGSGEGLQWDLLTPERVRTLLGLPVGHYPEFGGNKPAVRLEGEALRRFLTLRPL